MIDNIKGAVVEKEQVPALQVPLSQPDNRKNVRDRLWGLAVWTVILVSCFAKPLYDLFWFSWQSDVYSQILLIPLISLYLLWLNRGKFVPGSKPSWGLCVISLVLGAAALASYWLAKGSGWKLTLDDYLSLTTVSFLLFLLSGASMLLGGATLRRVAFPIAFLLCAVPLPAVWFRWIERFLQYRSADVAQVLFTMFGTPVLRQETLFQLPGFSLQVARECSGIHSSLTLFVTSLVAGYLFLRSPWKRAVFTLAVVPLGLLRNGFRIFVIGELCVQVSPEMINSFIHRKGGPIFFILSLVPLVVLLLCLRRSESKGRVPKESE